MIELSDAEVLDALNGGNDVFVDVEEEHRPADADELPASRTPDAARGDRFTSI